MILRFTCFQKCDLSQLSEEEQRVVERYQLEGNLNGLGLPPEQKEILDSINGHLHTEKVDFNRRIHVSKSLFNVKVLDPYVVRSFPNRLVESMAPDSKEPTTGPWIAPVEPAVCDKFLEYCPDDNLRAKVWKNRVIVASIELGDSEIQNSVSLQKIREYR